MAVEREVIYRLKAVVDPASQSAFQQMAQAHKQADTGAVAQAKQLAVTKSQTEEIKRQSSAYITASRDAITHADKLAAANATAASRVAKGWHDAGEGIAHAGRAIALFGAANERSMEQAIRGLAAYEAAAQGVRGAYGLAESVGPMLGVTTAGTAGTTAVALGAAIVGLTAVVIETKEALSGVADKAGSLTKAIAEGEVSVAQWLTDATGGRVDFVQGVTSLTAIPGIALKGSGVSAVDTGKTTRMEQAALLAQQADQAAAKRATAGIAASQQWLGNARSLDSAFLGDSSASAAMLASQRDVTRMTRDAEAYERSSGGGPQTAAVNAAAALKLRESITAESIKQLGISKQIADEERRAADTSIRSAKEGIQAAERQLELVKEKERRNMSTIERLADLDQAEASRLKSAAEQANRGGLPGYDDAKLLRGLGFDSTIERSALARTRELGLGSIVDPIYSQILAGRSEQTRLTGMKQQLEVTVRDSEAVKVQVEINERERNQEIARQVVEAVVAERNSPQAREQLRQFIQSELQSLMSVRSVQLGGRL